MSKLKQLEPLMYRRFDDDKEWTLASVVDDEYISMDEAMFKAEDARALRDWLSAALGEETEVHHSANDGGTVVTSGPAPGRLEAFTQTGAGVERRVSEDGGLTWSAPTLVFVGPVLGFQVWVDVPRRRCKFIADLAPGEEVP